MKPNGKQLDTNPEKGFNAFLDGVTIVGEVTLKRSFVVLIVITIL